MKNQNTEWDRSLRDRLRKHEHSTSIEWEQVEVHMSKRNSRAQLAFWARRVAAGLIVLFAAYLVLNWYSEPSWEYTPVASVTNLDDAESNFFSASELHFIYSQRK